MEFLSSFKKGKVKFMKEWNIDEYTAYHITENFDIDYELDKSNEVTNFPRRGKNIPEDILMRILGNMNIDPIWFFIEPLTAPVRFLDENFLPEYKKNDSGLTIPIYEQINQLTQEVKSQITLDSNILEFLDLGFIKSNEFHPIFRYPNYAFIRIKNEYCLTNLWDQELASNNSYVIYGKENLKLDKMKYQNELEKNSFVLGKIMLILNNLMFNY